MKRVQPFAFLLLASSLGAPPGGGAQGAPATGHTSAGTVEGELSVSFWPLDERGEPIDRSHFQVELAPESEPTSRVSLPAGQSWTLPVGQYSYWLEGDGWISPWAGRLALPDGPVPDDGRMAIPVARGGQVSVTGHLPRRAGELIVLGIDGHRRGEVLHPEMVRHETPVAAAAGVLMPAGRVVAAAVEPVSRNLLAVTRPIELDADTGLDLTLAPPEAGTDVALFLDRSSPRREQGDDDLAPVLLLDGTTPVEPALLVPARERVYAFWYGLEGRYGVVEARSATEYLPAREIPLGPGTVETVRATASSLPSLVVEAEFPPELTRRADLVVFDRASGQPLAAEELSEPSEVLFEHLPPTELTVVLDAAPWNYRVPVDLSDGANRRVRLALEPIPVFGRIFRGDEPHPGTVRFATQRKPGERVSAESDEQGRYEIFLYRPGFYYAEIELEGSHAPPFGEYGARRPIQGPTRWDFHVPANRYTVRVEDSAAGAPIPRAEVLVTSISGTTTRQSSLSLDADGRAPLPPVAAGELRLSARAPGYRPSPEMSLEAVEGDERELVIALDRHDAELRLRLELADGTPAAGAEVLAVGDPFAAQELGTSRADGTGEVSLPGHLPPGSLLMVRHPRAGSMVAEPPAPTADATAWRLPPVASVSLRVAVEKGGEPGARRAMAVWFGRHPMAGAALNWLSGSRASGTDGAGIWVGGNLPATEVAVLAFDPRRTSLAAIVSGALDPLAQRIAYPWPEVVRVEAIE